MLAESLQVEGAKVTIVGGEHTHSFPRSKAFIGSTGTIVDRDGCLWLVRLDTPIKGERHYWAWASELSPLLTVAIATKGASNDR
jgi:hypothetical protein